MLLVACYCVVIVAVSLTGGWLPVMLRLTHTRMQLMMSFVGGLMLGVAILHLHPHAVMEAKSLNLAAYSALLGVIATFFLIRVFHVHQHAPSCDLVHNEEHHEHHYHWHEESVESLDDHHDHQHSHDHKHVGWLGVFIGFSLHTIIDGVALAASVATAHAGESELGLGTFLAVVLHKPLDALAITSVMVRGGWSRKSTAIINFCFALMCPLGAIVFFTGVNSLTTMQGQVIGCALGFSAGVFLCFALADILPELQFHQHDRFKLSMALLAGVFLAYVIGFFEPAHDHAPHDENVPGHVHDHEHDHP